VLLQRQTKSVHVESKIHDQIAQLMPHFEVRDCELNSVGGTDRLFYQVNPIYLPNLFLLSNLDV
jgi:hypothetical protein